MRCDGCLQDVHRARFVKANTWLCPKCDRQDYHPAPWLLEKIGVAGNGQVLTRAMADDARARGAFIEKVRDPKGGETHVPVSKREGTRKVIWMGH